MTERVRFGDLGGGEFGIRVARPGQSALTDPYPVLYTAYEAQQILQVGYVDEATVPDGIGDTIAVSFGTTYPFVPSLILSATLDFGGEHLRDIGELSWANTPFTNKNQSTGFQAQSITTTGFTLFAAKRAYAGGAIVSRNALWALSYIVTKVELQT